MAQIRSIDEMFDLERLPLVYGSRGVTIDFSKNQDASVDADLFAEALSTLFAYDSPVTILERSLTTTGAAQQLILPAPIIGDANIADETRVVAVDLAIQLNSFTLTKTDIKFDLLFLDGTGATIVPRTQTIEGNAAVLDGNTRQYIRMLCSEQNSVFNTASVTSSQDGKLVSLPRFQGPNAVNLATALAALGLTGAQARTVFASLAQDVGQIVIDIPAGAFAAGVILTASVVTIGRLGVVADIMKSLDAAKSAANAPMVDEGRRSLLTELTKG
jgi:hypothetical protein